MSPRHAPPRQLDGQAASSHEEEAAWPEPRAQHLYHQLVERWGERPCCPDSDYPVVQSLVWAILSQRTNYLNQKRAYARLVETVPTWQELADADIARIEEAIQTATFPEVKAPVIKRLLNELFEAQESYDLEWLRDADVERAYTFLTQFHGIGPKSASITLLFNLGKPILPVDTHVSRVSRRYGLIPMKSGDAKAHELLNAMMPPGDTHAIYNFHRDAFLHGQKICTYSSPKCERCPLRHDCDYYAAHHTA